MNGFKLIFTAAMLTVAATLVACSSDYEEHADHEQEASGEYPRGPHRGRLLTEGDFSVEITIFEQGLPPEFRVYAYRDGAPVKPTDVDLRIELGRLGGIVDGFGFKPEGNYLRGDAEVIEPHSFDVKVMASTAGQQHVWEFESYEGRVTIAPEQAKSAGIKTAIAGSGLLKDTVTLYGNIHPNAERVRQVTARFPGVIRSVKKQIGDAVKAGEVLATVESNESLQAYAVTAPLAGTVVERHANAGESAGAEALFVVADYSSVWVDLTVFPRDRARLAVGQSVTVSSVDGAMNTQGSIALIAPTSEPASQNLVARLVLDNPTGEWTPGLFVTGMVTVSEAAAELVVPVAALQAFRDFTVVFAQVGDTYEVRMLELGRNDGAQVEVLGGLAPGTRYVIENSYLIKADIEKSGASHDH